MFFVAFPVAFASSAEFFELGLLSLGVPVASFA